MEDSDFVILENDPKKGLFITSRRGRYDGNHKDETKQCGACKYLKKAIPTKNPSHRLTEQQLQELKGVCSWGVGWKIVWKRENPRACVLV